MSRHLRFFFMAMFFSFCGLISFSSPSSADSYEIVDMAGVEIKMGEYHIWELGELEAHTEIYFYISTEGKWEQDEEFDCLFMNQTEYDAWLGGDSLSFNFDASAFAVDGYEPYYYTLNGPPYSPSSDSYYYVIDNRNGISDILMDDIADIDGYTPPPGDWDYRDPIEYRTRIWLNEGDIRFREVGNSRVAEEIELGNYISFTVDASLSSEDDLLAVWLFEEEEMNKWLNGIDSYQHNRNASIFVHGDWLGMSSYENWYYEPTTVTSWYLLFEAREFSQGAHIDIAFSSDETPDGEGEFDWEDKIFTRTTRMIDENDVWTVDLGQVEAGDNIRFAVDVAPLGYGSEGELDVFIMEKSEAERYLGGVSGQYEVLGHPSMIGVDDTEWDYLFPESGEYWVVIDNTDNPSGGTDSSGDIHVAFEFTQGPLYYPFSTTHYLSENSFVSFDLGQLNGDEELDYQITGEYHGATGALFPGFDVLLMTNDNYQNYISGSDFEYLDDVNEDGYTLYSELDDTYVWNHESVTEEGHYWLVVDTTSAPSDGADSLGPWTIEIDICVSLSYCTSSVNGIVSPEAMNQHYKMTITIDPSDGDDETTGGEDTGGEDTGGNGTKEEELVDLTEAKPESDSPSIGLLMVSLCLIACAIFSKRHKI